MSILNILLYVGVVNLISPAFGDIDPVVKYYNPVAAVLCHHTNQSEKVSCPGAMVWVKHWQVFIGSSTCRKKIPGVTEPRIRVGGIAGGDTNGKETHRLLMHTFMNDTFGVQLRFFQGAHIPGQSFPMTQLFMPGILQRHKNDAIIDPLKTTITISRDTWGPHHEVKPIMDNGSPNEMILSFTEPVTSEGKCPEEVEWGPAMLPSYWGVPLIIGVFKKSESPSTVKHGVCNVSLRYTSIIPAVGWIEKTVTRYYERLSQFENEDAYIDHLKKTQNDQE